MKVAFFVFDDFEHPAREVDNLCEAPRTLKYTLRYIFSSTSSEILRIRNARFNEFVPSKHLLIEFNPGRIEEKRWTHGRFYARDVGGLQYQFTDEKEVNEFQRWHSKIFREVKKRLVYQRIHSIGYYFGVRAVEIYTASVQRPSLA